MKKSYAKLFVLVPLVLLGSCKRSEADKRGVGVFPTNQTTSVIKDIDTFRVTGVYDYYLGFDNVYRHIACIDKRGNEEVVICNMLKSGLSMRGALYIERGDTIVLKGDTLVENLTRKRIKSEFVNGR